MIHAGIGLDPMSIIRPLSDLADRLDAFRAAVDFGLFRPRASRRRKSDARADQTRPGKPVDKKFPSWKMSDMAHWHHSGGLSDYRFLPIAEIRTTVSNPARAATCAMPAPIRPQPTTPTF